MNQEQKPTRKPIGPVGDQGATSVLRGDMAVTQKIS